MAKRIFVLEDNDDIREIVSILLMEEHYEVIAYSSISALRKGVLTDGKADLFLLDVMLPDGNGMDYCKELRESVNTAKMPVVMMSANFTPDDMNDKCIAQDFIHKPFEIDDFIRRISAQIH